jgi:hypothetical protein
MSSVQISGNAAGTGVLTIASPNTNSNYTATLPTATTTLVGTDATQTLTNKTITGAIMTSMASSVITAGTAVATTSGSAVDFTGIPSWVKRITVMLNGVGGTGDIFVRLGTSAGGIITTGYGSGSENGNGGLTPRVTTTYFYGAVGATTASTGHVVITNVSGNTWVASGLVIDSLTGTSSVSLSYTFSTGNITLASTLDRVRVATVAFTAGSVNILYE